VLTFLTVAVLLISVVLLTLGVAPISAITGSVEHKITWSASQTPANSPTGASTIQNSETISRKSTYSATGAGANSINQAMRRFYSIAGGGSTTIDLAAAVRNIVNDATATFARVKTISIRLLSIGDDATNGTAATSITIGAAASNQFISQASGRGFMGTTTSTFDIPNGGGLTFSCDNAAGVLVDGTHKDLKIANNDGSVAASVEIALLGADS